jgi:1-aminocyclopropane-1-carboxylate deaminase/D-cysteine desulfhydrase-like pyridoxal-dependent ACC family enzyme
MRATAGAAAISLQGYAMLDQLPRVRFAHLPTPLEEASRLARALGGPRILIKREDLSGLAFGGNKSRLMEYVMGDLLARGVDAVVAAAAAQSNKLREVAAAAARFGLRAVLLIDDERPACAPQGNLLLLDLLGAEVRFLGKPPPGHDMLSAQTLVVAQDEVRAELERAGHVVEILDRRRAYGALATAAYVDAACELVDQFAAQAIDPDQVFVTAGGSATIAGLVLGLKHRGSRARVVGASILQAPEVVKAGAVDLAARCSALLGIPTTIEPADFTVLDYAAPGYGIVTRPVVEAVRLAATQHGMVLDPVYNGKTMAALIDQIRSHAIGPEQSVVYVNTGGGPALFAYANEIAQQSAG